VEWQSIIVGLILFATAIVVSLAALRRIKSFTTGKTKAHCGNEQCGCGSNDKIATVRDK
jgi:hypothetical protein